MKKNITEAFYIEALEARSRCEEGNSCILPYVHIHECSTHTSHMHQSKYSVYYVFTHQGTILVVHIEDY